MEDVCKECRSQPVTMVWLCQDCFYKLYSEREAEREERRSDYKNHSPMDWDQWIDWLSYYGLPVGNHFVFALKMYVQYGCELPFHAWITDHHELQDELFYYQTENVSEELQRTISLATAERLCREED